MQSISSSEGVHLSPPSPPSSPPPDNLQQSPLKSSPTYESHSDAPSSTSLSSPLKTSQLTGSPDHGDSKNYQKPISTFNQIPFQTLSHRIEKGTKVCIDLYGVMKGRLDLLDQELRFSDKISRINIYENEIPLSSSEKSIGMMKNYFLYLTRELAESRKYLDESIAKEMEGFKLSRQKQTTQYGSLCQTAISEVDIAYQKLDFTKDKANLIETTLMGTKSKLNGLQLQLDAVARLSAEEKTKREKEKEKNIMGRMFSSFQNTPEQERDKLRKKANQLQFESMSCLEEMLIRRKELLRKIEIRDEAISKASLEFQKIEKERLDKLKVGLRRFCDFEKRSLAARMQLVDDLESAVMEVDSVSDINKYIEKEKYPEGCHKYGKALSLLDWNYEHRNHRDGSIDKIRGSFNGTSTNGRNVHIDTREIESRDRAGSETAAIINSSLTEKKVDLQDQTKDELSNGSGSEQSARDDEVIRPRSSETRVGACNIDLEDVECTNAENLTVHENLEEAKLKDTSNDCSKKELIGADDDSHLDQKNDVNDDSPVVNEDNDIDVVNKKRLELEKIMISLFPNLNENFNETAIDQFRSHDFDDGVFDNDCNREFFLRQLDIARGGKKELNTEDFGILEDVMVCFLTACERGADITGALRAANMANTFHCHFPGRSIEEGDKQYIMHATSFREHSIWRSFGFWERALDETVRQQLVLQDAVKWDDLGQAQLIENVINTHNLVFSQLASLAFTMHELGLESEEILLKAAELASTFELSEDQQIELYNSIENNFS